LLRRWGLFLPLLLLLLPDRAGAGQPLRLAVAANFAPAMEEIAARYRVETGVSLQVTVSSSGRFFAQIRQGAPYDLYFSANGLWPEKLYEQGLCAKPKRYAGGTVVLWSADPSLCPLRTWRDVVRNGAVSRLAMPSPQSAPYGTAARQACRRLAIWPEIEQKLVYGGNVSQAFQYAGTGVADAAFIARSLVGTPAGRQGCFWEIPESVPVDQKACVLSRSLRKKTAAAFMSFVLSEQTGVILQSYGYR